MVDFFLVAAVASSDIIDCLLGLIRLQWGWVMSRHMGVDCTIAILYTFLPGYLGSVRLFHQQLIELEFLD